MRYFIILCSILLAFPQFCNAEYGKISPIRPDIYGGYLGDIDCRTPNVEMYRDSDKVTHAHECTHSINSAIRQKFKAQNGYYLLKGTCFYLKNNPKFTLRDVANKIPANKRGKIYQLYMVEQTQYWNDTPLYVIDECISYLNGTIVGIEVKEIPRAKDSFVRCLEMLTYSKYAVDMCKDTKYEQYEELNDFMNQLTAKHIKPVMEYLNEN